MVNRMSYKDLEAARLAPQAVKSAQTRGRRHAESEHPFRTAFQRDRDRVIHCNAFRRLEYKTQVFVFHEGDHYRTRLTHTIEVAQITRTIARALGLNEDLSEAIALAHDLGHPPFGHSGEEALNKLLAGHGGFEHNGHGLRIVEELETRYPGFKGLNLTWEVREGIVKHKSAHDRPFENDEYDSSKRACLEAQIADIADEIAYNNHDIDDGLSSEMLGPDALVDVALWQENFDAVKREFGREDFKVLKCQTVIRIINAQVTDLVDTMTAAIAKEGIRSVDDVRDAGRNIAQFSDEMKEKNRELKRFLYENLYRHRRVLRMADKAERIINELWGAYSRAPYLLPPRDYSLIETGAQPPWRVICDYIAGMTDRFALDEYKKLFDPYEKV
ncbi:MAG: deoxyguanosinetriphosphate triphosphohydrolase [Deltaproteobacteria bacterium RIFCSPLOWO2_02_FULL_53_8]|nr:MAG: deoxyguanosinetriphosphate triphosphohydrolase [Deltaproteobacteria bacterium RIFCSPLOWO2_02_FULL_53_8]